MLRSLSRMATAAAESAAKRLKTESSSSPVTIGTHNGHFHADEALAVHMLRRHVPTYAGAKLVRTRDPALLATCHTVVDVGGVHDPAARRFDHHQRGFAATFPGRPTKLSSAGLVYAHFGREIIARRLEKEKESSSSSSSSTEVVVDLLYRKLYENFIEALDAHDNGIDAYDPALLAAAGITRRFAEGGFTLGAVVGRYNAAWNAPPQEQTQAAEDARFEAASARVGDEFDRDLDYYVAAWLPARALVAEAFAARRAHGDAAGRILVLRGQACPWKDHLYALEEEEVEEEQAQKGGGNGGGGSSEKVLYVLYPEKPTADARWRVQCVPVAKDSFESRRPLPEAWRGHRDEELDTITSGGGVEPGCIFVHASGFIGGHKTFEGALQMARRALEM